jgi:hypothetical protein
VLQWKIRFLLNLLCAVLFPDLDPLSCSLLLVFSLRCCVVLLVSPVRSFGSSAQIVFTSVSFSCQSFSSVNLARLAQRAFLFVFSCSHACRNAPGQIWFSFSLSVHAARFLIPPAVARAEGVPAELLISLLTPVCFALLKIS